MHGLDLHDHGARWSDTNLGRWWKVDPLAEKFYDTSPYVLCGNNPLKYVDPNGHIIKLIGSQEDRIVILNNLQKLTNNKLGIKKDGSVYIINGIISNKNKQLKLGSALISSLINSDKEMNISITKEDNRLKDHNAADATNKIGTNVDVKFNPTQKRQISTINPKTGRLQPEFRPPHIGLAHELIHGFRSMNGVGKSLNKLNNYYVIDYKGDKIIKNAPIEELETVGIGNNSKYTENKIREEQGYNLRGAY